MKINWKKLIICLIIPLATGGLSTLFSGGMSGYQITNQPPLSPPGWVFPVVWTVLYLLMGYASYQVLTSDADKKQSQKALRLYGAQLALNFLWPIIFFGFDAYLPAFILLIGLWVLIFLTTRIFSNIDATAGNLLLPYLLWVTFAGYLNLGVYLLN